MSQTVASRPELEAARLLLERMGICPADLLEVRPARPPAPTFAEYVPIVAAAVSSGTRRAYGSYWNRVVQAWGDRRIDEPRPSEIEQLRTQVQAFAPLDAGCPALFIQPCQVLREPLSTGQIGDFSDLGGVLDEPYPALVGHVSWLTRWLPSSGSQRSGECLRWPTPGRRPVGCGSRQAVISGPWMA